MRKRTKPENADIAVARAAAPARRSPAVKALGWVGDIADQPPLITLCAVTFAAGLILRNGRLARAGGRMLAAELLATKAKDVIKHQVDRARPYVLAEGGRYEAKPGNDHAKGMTSFPSGHTAGAVAVARAYAREYPEHAGRAFAAAAAVGAIQVARSKHYPTDVAAGAVVGLAAEKGVNLVEGVVSRAASPPDAGTASPEVSEAMSGVANNRSWS